jgi:hypothetical protein
VNASPPSSRAVDRITAGGLLVGAGFGLAGTLVANLLGWAWTLCRTP